MPTRRIVEMESKDGVYDAGMLLQLRFGGKDTWIGKNNIHAIRVINPTTICLDNGEQPLQHIYIRIEDVHYPKEFANASDLASQISSFFTNTTLGGDSNQLTTVINELQQINQTVQEIKGLLQTSPGGDTVVPNVEDDTQAGYVYKGYILPTLNPSNPKEANWRIERVNLIDVRMGQSEWADGDKNYDNSWEDRYGITYLPLGVVITPHL
jgi:hypothetical protein